MQKKTDNDSAGCDDGELSLTQAYDFICIDNTVRDCTFTIEDIWGDGSLVHLPEKTATNTVPEHEGG